MNAVFLWLIMDVVFFWLIMDVVFVFCWLALMSLLIMDVVSIMILSIVLIRRAIFIAAAGTSAVGSCR